MRLQVPEPMGGSIKVTINFNLKRPKSVTRQHPSVRPDIDNYLKSTLDAGNGVLWEDEGQIVSLRAQKRSASEDSIEILVEQISSM